MTSLLGHPQRGVDGEDHIHVGKLNLVDLAGSERQSKTGATVSTGRRKRAPFHLSLSLYIYLSVCRANDSRSPQRSTCPSLR